MRKQAVCVALAALTAVAIFSSTAMASAFRPTNASEPFDLFWRAKVICEQRKESEGTRVFSARTETHASM